MSCLFIFYRPFSIARDPHSHVMENKGSVFYKENLL